MGQKLYVKILIFRNSY